MLDVPPALAKDLELLTGLLDGAVETLHGEGALRLVRRLRESAAQLRAGRFPGGRRGFGALFEALGLPDARMLAATFSQFFHLVNAAEEQHRIRVLRERDRPGAPPGGSIASAVRTARDAGASPQRVQRLLGRLLVMPVLTAHPTEARRRSVLEHLRRLSGALDRLDDGRLGEWERLSTLDELRNTVLALAATAEVRPHRPSPLDEVRSGLNVFESSLLDTTPEVIRALELALRSSYPEDSFTVGPFLRWGSWIGGDRDGNPHVTPEVTRIALERQRSVAIRRLLADMEELQRVLSVSSGARPPPPALAASLEEDRARLGALPRPSRHRDFEPWREKLAFMQARLEGALVRAEEAYPDARRYLDDLRLVAGSLEAAGLGQLSFGRVRAALRRAEVFGFHLASLDLRQHSQVHEAAVDELLRRGGTPGYQGLGEAQRSSLLSGLVQRTELGVVRSREGLSPQTSSVLESFEVVGRARRDIAPEACERYVVSFTREVSDLLEVMLLSRLAGLGAGELRPVPLLEQREDLERAEELARTMAHLAPLRGALRGELEVMIGYSDSGKQVGYVASAVALHQAQEALARVAGEEGLTLTVFHGRGGAVGRGGGPAGRTIRAQPAAALDGRLRVTEQGETIAARYARPEIARRDLEQMVGAVLLGSLLGEQVPEEGRRAMAKAEEASRAVYGQLRADEGRLAAYVRAATPIEEIAEMRIGSRPASRSAELSLEDLRAIPWVFSWNQSRHGVPGWFGLGTALGAVRDAVGQEGLSRLYREWRFFRALVDNAQLALARSDIEVASCYAALADPAPRGLFSLIEEEHRRTVSEVLGLTGGRELLERWPTLAKLVRRRNPYVDVLSHLQIELLGRLRRAPPQDQEELRQVLLVTVSGIAAGLQSAG